MIRLDDIEARAKAAQLICNGDTPSRFSFVCNFICNTEELCKFHESITTDNVLALIRVVKKAQQLTYCACQETLDELEEALKEIGA